jgi:hypothetical protein
MVTTCGCALTIKLHILPTQYIYIYIYICVCVCVCVQYVYNDTQTLFP